ncbi:sigma-70 family RNA polymerase sigma factor [Actinacidiphila alni]|uniref:sigma-70 family RNA polymerase sigma factor n=1 Tax=Actinacidiphila alni TaxID=380248 RepID=UPI0034572503
MTDHDPPATTSAQHLPGAGQTGAGAFVRGTVDEVPEPTSLLPHPDAYADWEDQHMSLALLRSLPPRQRQVLAWTLDGYAPAKIAEQLSMTSEAVRAGLKKARLAAVRYLAARKDDDR